MLDSSTLALRQQLEALAIDYWHEVDMNGGTRAPSYYTDDAVFGTSAREYHGRAAIEQFYGGRQARPARVSLHLMQNFRITVEPEGEAHCHYYLSLFAADGEPVRPSLPATMVAAVHEIVLQEPDGVWRYRSRKVRPLFRDGSPSRG
ncbi:MAG: nuclear transport factor 2 family protein [Pseudomonadota bacterium]